MALPKDFEDRQVVVLGLGYVGLTLGAYLSELGFQVHGVEIRDLVLDSLKPIADNESFVSVSVSPRKCKKFGCAFILRLISWIF